MRLLDSSTLANQNITTALLLHTYTADIARGVYIQVFLDQIAGNGTYIFYRTVQKAGAGSAYEGDSRLSAVVPTSITATLCDFAGIKTNLQATDVLKVYAIGLGGDTTTPDVRTEIWTDDYLRPSTVDRSLDVSAGGEAGIDWANIGSPTTVVNLAGTSTLAVEPTTAGRKLDVASTGEAGLDFANVKAATAPTVLSNITIPTVTTLTNDPVGLDADIATLQTEVDSIFTKTDALPLDPVSTTALDASLVVFFNSTDGQIALIKAKTDNLPANPAAVNSAMDLKSSLNATAVTQIQSGLATASALTTISNKLGTWTGSGRNTIKGAMQALFRKDTDASVPSDINENLGSGSGTADNTTDSLQGVRDRGDAAWTTGSGGDSAAAIADAVWDEPRAGHTTNGTFGQGQASVQGNVTGSVASVAGAVGSVTGNVGGNLVGNVNGNVAGNVSGTIPDSAGVTTLLSRITSGRALLLDNLAVLAGWTGTLLNLLRAGLRNDVSSVDIGGDYDGSTDSQQASREKLEELANEPPQVNNVLIEELNA